MGWKGFRLRVRKEILTNQQLSPAVKVFALYMLSQEPGWKYKTTNVAREFKVTRQSVLAWRKALLEAGILREEFNPPAPKGP